MQHEHTHSSMSRAIPTESKIGTFMGLVKRLAVRGLRGNFVGSAENSTDWTKNQGSRGQIHFLL